MQKYLEAAGVTVPVQHGSNERTVSRLKEVRRLRRAIECKVNGQQETEIPLTENDLVFVTNGSCTEGTIYGDQNHAPVGDAEVRTSGCWSLWKNIATQDAVLRSSGEVLLRYCKDRTGSPQRLPPRMRRSSLISRRSASEIPEPAAWLPAVS